MDKSSVEPTIFFIEKISFSLKLFSGHFYGQSFIKTVRGPLSLIGPVVSEEMFENVDGRTDEQTQAGMTGILITHPWAQVS